MTTPDTHRPPTAPPYFLRRAASVWLAAAGRDRLRTNRRTVDPRSSERAANLALVHRHQR